MGVGAGMGSKGRTLAQLVQPAAVRALDMPLWAQVEVDFWVSQRAATAIAGDMVGIDSDDFKRLGHDLTPSCADG
jgi:nitrate/nitrite transporter NarK